MTEQERFGPQDKISKDIFFLNIEDAYSEAIKQNKIVDEKGYQRLQYCYYDGPLTDIVLNNFIQVSADNFVDFFAHNHLPIPQIIAISQDGVVHFNEMPADVIEEIQQYRNQYSVPGYIHADTYFVDPLLALNIAKQLNRVNCGHPTIDGLQVCYYRGELPTHDIGNLIHIEFSDIIDFFVMSRLRVPEKIEMPCELEEELKAAVKEDFVSALEAIKDKRLVFVQQLTRVSKALEPAVVEGEPIRVFIPSSRLTTVMQYSSQGVAKAFEKQGYQVLFYIESNDMEGSNAVDFFNTYINFNPHVTFNVNNVNNGFLHDDVINIMWWQDLMPAIRNHQLLNWRKNDFNFSISPIFDQHLKQCGAEKVQRQHFVFDEAIFYSDNKQLQQKIVFVGSSYLPAINFADNQQMQAITELVEILNQGRSFDKQAITTIAERTHLNYEFVFWKLLHYVVRDYSVKWLCRNSNLPVEIYGRYWEQDSLVAPFYQGELQHGVQVADVYRSATYAIVSHPFEINSQRLVEVAACGCIPVVYDCRDIAETPHWDEFCLFFKTEQDLTDIFENRAVPAKSPLLLAQKFTYDTAVYHFIEQSAIQSLSNVPASDAVENHS